MNPNASTERLSAHLWDLRAHAEAKLRCLTRLQQLLANYEKSSDVADRARKHKEIMKDVADLALIGESLRSVAKEAVKTARTLK
jgi:hypothetical protein